MVCPYCQYANRESANFCLNCGQKIVFACERCDTRLPLFAVFCDHCGLQVGDPAKPLERTTPEQQPAVGVHSEPDQPLILEQRVVPQAALSRYIPSELEKKLNDVRSRGEMIGERRVVTMLFCDIVGSTAVAEKLDPEDWTEIINNAFEYMIKPIYKYEGTVARLMGDAILAFFGAPIAHEDDPQRAALAGLEIVSGMQTLRTKITQRFGVDINVRVGINTGMVVVGAVGSDLHMEYTALGDAINVAARMEQTAQPGTVQITEDTYRQITPYFKFQELGKLPVKGKTEPLLTYRVLASKQASGKLRGIAGIEVPMIGRDEELGQLQNLLAQVNLGVGRIVSVIGDAGMGKSRLIDEGLKHWQKGNSNPLFYQISSQSYETSQAYGLFQRLFRRMIDIARDDPAGIIQNKIELFLNKMDASDHPTARLVFQTILGLEPGEGVEPLVGEAFKRELYAVTEYLFSGMFADRPSGLVFEDIQWSDPASVDLMLHLLPLVEKVPLVMIFSLRPDRQAAGYKLKKHADEKHHHLSSEIHLEPLSEETSVDLINHLLSIADISDTLRHRIIDRAGGNPFFIEEVVRTLIENGVVIPEERINNAVKQVYWRAAANAAEVEIPKSLQSLLIARIDRLEEDVRQTLQLASVIGRKFYERILIALVASNHISSLEIDRQLKKLLRLEMVYEVARQPEVEYSFQTPMIQETAYGSILKKRRRSIHQQVAETIEHLYPEQLNDLAAQLGFHYRESNNYEQAMKYYTIAGDNAFKLYANTLTVSHYGEALAAARSITPVPLEQIQYLYGRRGRALELESRFQDALENYSEELAFAREIGAASMELNALVSLGTVYTIASDRVNPEKGEALALEALTKAEHIGDKEAQARIYWNLLNLYRYVGRYQEAAQAGERGLKIAEEIGIQEIIAYLNNDLPYAYFGLSEIEDAYSVLKQAIKMWREMDNQPMLADSLSSASFSSAYLGLYDEAISMSDEAKQISQEIDNPWGIVYSRFYVGFVFEDRGQMEKAICDYEIILKMGKDAEFFIGEFWGIARLTHIYTQLNALEQSEYYIEQAAADILDYDGLLGLYASMITLEKVSLLLAQGDIDKAARLFSSRKFENSLANALTRDYVREVHIRVLLAQGEDEEALQHNEEYIADLNDSKNKSFLHQMLLFKGIAHHRLYQHKQAAAALNDALTIAQDLGARWRLWQILSTLADVEDKLNNSSKAASLRNKAVEYVDSICAEISRPELRESFLNRLDVKELMSDR